MRFILPRFFINCERWKWNNDLRVYVSTFGHVKDEHKKNVAPKINNSGYFIVRIKDKWISIHRLVLLTWRPLPNDGESMTVDHLDSNRRNNHLDNLEWVSQDENFRRANEKLCKEKEEKKESLPSLESVNHIKKPLGPFVRWEELCEKFGYDNTTNTPFQYNGSIDEVRELWESGTVTIYKGQSNTEITPAVVYRKIANQPEEARLILERFLKKSITRTGRYLGWTPWMRWTK